MFINLNSVVRLEKNKIVSKVVANQFSNQSLKNLFSIHNFQIIFFKAKIDGTTIIVKKLNKTKKYKKNGNIYFEIFYFKYLLHFISQIMFILLNIKVKIRNILK